MKLCEYPGCNRGAHFLMGWNNENGRHSGLVCATHDKELGRKNLSKYMPVPECILFERYLKETVDLPEYLDWPEWLTQYIALFGKPHHKAPEDNESELKELNLSSMTLNALHRHQIRTIDELEDMSKDELMKIRWIGVRGVAEIQKALDEIK